MVAGSFRRLVLRPESGIRRSSRHRAEAVDSHTESAAAVGASAEQRGT